MKHVQFPAAILAISMTAAFALADEAKLANEKPLRLTGFRAAPNAACLSPDGRMMLYIRREEADKPKGYAGSWSGSLCRLVLHEIRTGKETVLPSGPFTWADPLQMLLSRQPFDAKARTVLMYVSAGDNDDGIHDLRAEAMRVGVYTLATGRTAKLKPEGPIVFPAQGRDMLLLSLWDKREGVGTVECVQAKGGDWAAGKMRTLGASGIGMAVSPAGTVAAVWKPPIKRGQTQEWFLFDLKSDTRLADMPISSQNTHMDDFPPVWSSDGRFLYYVDNLDASAAATRRSARKGTRVWDVQAGKQAAELAGLVPMGTGPGGTVVLMGPGGGTVTVHDAAGARQWSVEGLEGRIFWAGGGEVLLERKTEDGQKGVFLADLVLPKQAIPPGQEK